MGNCFSSEKSQKKKQKRIALVNALEQWQAIDAKDSAGYWYKARCLLYCFVGHTCGLFLWMQLGLTLIAGVCCAPI
jgi:hypothetical protein